jgi:SAM-dependent methyltransferase
MSTLRIETSKPIAYDSPDHLQPYGTAQDNTTSRRFNRKLFDYIPAKRVRLLDIGCSGGGLVKTILDDGGFGVGIEGSDYSKRHRRAEWATIPDHLFTADVTERFQLTEDRGGGSTEPLLFNVVTAWEFFEHIAEDRLPGVIENIRRHLAPQGIVLASIATHEEHLINGVQLHQTVHRKGWWIKFFARHGLQRQGDVEHYFHFDTVRGAPTAFGPSFTIALTRAGETPPEPETLRSLRAKNRLSETGKSLSRLAHYKTWWHLSCYAFPGLRGLRKIWA